jgi:hypothetical protein
MLEAKARSEVPARAFVLPEDRKERPGRWSRAAQRSKFRIEQLQLAIARPDCGASLTSR